MTPGGRLFAAALSVLLAAGGASGATLTIESAKGPLLEFPVPEGATWCLCWSHSVTGGPVADCFVNRSGRMILARSYLHDFAAGLGEVPGRGTLRPAAEGGYWIENMDEPVPGNALVLRVGRPAVNHRLAIGGGEYSLSAVAAGRRVTLRLEP
ncbi:MAG TPA: DUF1850 domain-containing protein [Thermohalobaculum sp.]|nr:DUF1850 domain-containing protein [Thermohalobaculum sp.]